MAEIQVTTQMQDVLRAMTHVYYRERRIKPQPKSADARWNFSSPDFRATYLGHTLHLLEGIVAELRSATAEPQADNKKQTQEEGA